MKTSRVNQNFNGQNLDELTFEQKAELLKYAYVSYPIVKRITKDIEFCHKKSRFLPNPQGAYILGDAGAGKTQLCKKYMLNYPRYEIINDKKTQTIVPVLYAKVIGPTRKNLSESLLSALGDPFSHREDTGDNKFNRMVKLLHDCKVELIFLDELQQIKDLGGEKNIKEASNWIKGILEVAKIPIVCAGLTYSELIITGDPQLESRFRKRRHEIPKLCLDPPNDYAGIDIQSFLKVLEPKLPFKLKSNLHVEKKAKYLLDACEGNMRVLMEQIIIPAGLTALEENRNKLDFELLEMEAETVQTARKEQKELVVLNTSKTTFYNVRTG